MKPQTKDDLARMAAHIDRAASDRYDRLAQEMVLCGKTDVADSLRRLAEDKRRQLREMGAGDSIAPETEQRTTDSRWNFSAAIDESRNADQDGFDELYSMTPQQALNLAIRIENQSVAFFADVSAHAKSEEVAEFAEDLARMGLDELRQLRLRRRQVNRSRPQSAYRKKIQELTRQAHGTTGREPAIRGIVHTLAQRLEIVAAVAAADTPDDADRIADALALVQRLGIVVPERSSRANQPDDDPFSEPPGTRALADVEIAFDGLMAAADEGVDEVEVRLALDLAAGLIPVFRLLRDNSAAQRK